jgi:hypothetical protein
MGILTRQNGDGESYVDLTMMDGIKTIKPNSLVRLTILNDGRLEIRQRIFKNDPVYLKLSQITNVGLITEKEIMEKSKSVIGRAAVGGLLLGPLGAMVGGMSGVGDKKKQRLATYYIINYSSGVTGNPAVLSFKLAGYPMKKFTQEIKEKAGIPEKTAQEEFNPNL